MSAPTTRAREMLSPWPRRKHQESPGTLPKLAALFTKRRRYRSASVRELGGDSRGAESPHSYPAWYTVAIRAEAQVTVRLATSGVRLGSAYGIRTRVTGVRGRRPGPLDERATVGSRGGRRAGARTIAQGLGRARSVPTAFGRVPFPGRRPGWSQPGPVAARWVWRTRRASRADRATSGSSSPL